jgi:ATP-binding cassette subfamily B protein
MISGKKDNNTITKKAMITFCRKYFKGSNHILIMLLVIIVLGIVGNNILPYFYGKIIDVLTNAQMRNFNKYIAVYFTLLLLCSFLTAAEKTVGNLFVFTITNKIKGNIYNKITKMQQYCLEKFSVGELISRLESDAGNIVSFCINFISSSILIIFNFIIAGYMIVAISRSMAYLALIYIPVSVLIYVIFKKKLRKLTILRRRFGDKFYTYMNDSLSNILGIKAFQLESEMSGRYDNLLSKQVKLEQDIVNLGNKVQISNSFASTLFNLVIMYLAAGFIGKGHLSIGSFVSFNLYIGKLMDAVQNVQSINMDKQRAFVSLERICSFIENPVEDVNGHFTGIIKEKFSSLSVKGLKFNYGENKVLRNLDFEINSYGLYSIIGKNGSGKSTLIKLLIKLYTPLEGEISLNEHPYRTLPAKELREYITYIQKETFILNDSIINNLRLADKDLDLMAAEEACKKAGLHEYIITLPEGYDTQLGEKGMVFSSGLRQKLNFARALIKNSYIILLDEITSDLDGESEKEIVGILKRLSKEKVLISISHKIETIINSDEIFIMDHGRLSEHGRHDELMEKSQTYKGLINKIQDK